MTETLEQGGCKWMTSYEHLLTTGSVRRAGSEFVACARCGNRVLYSDSWVTVPYGVHGNLLPLPVFVHCWACSLVLDPKYAYQLAFAKDAGAKLPDPDKVKRQSELEVDLIGSDEKPVHRHDHGGL